jgi:hypothetical protein
VRVDALMLALRVKEVVHGSTQYACNWQTESTVSSKQKEAVAVMVDGAIMAVSAAGVSMMLLASLCTLHASTEVHLKAPIFWGRVGFTSSSHCTQIRLY